MKYWSPLLACALLPACQQEKPSSEVKQPDRDRSVQGVVPSVEETATEDTTHLPYPDDTGHGADGQAALTTEWPKPDSFTPEQLEKLTEALRLANRLIKDPLFAGVLRDLQDRGQIDWRAPGTKRRYSRLPQDQWARPTAYIMEQFIQKQLNPITDFRPYRWAPGSDVTGSSTCVADPKINVNLIMNRSLGNIAGTIIHERVHTFCQRHTCNCPEENQCDLAYQAGSLARAINLYRANGSRPVSLRRHKLCAALKARLEARRLAS
ncbi:hypothetical protein [Hymenobacter arizonensis]|uniref:Uncharacterized protein n=1 Tax=Hymenobacter arizonensis TaxID=1227077 RepID=A0A1I6BG95_HYMAR|nr:hypothetical protein [Hymenobacter arizonensis]SFQ79955.1 hypothetical protein SAMN04515668_4520 [Hymenobacter arizonensis]